jgi:hypothetical protein
MDAERCKTHLGTKIEIKNEARNRWMHRVDRESVESGREEHGCDPNGRHRSRADDAAWEQQGDGRDEGTDCHDAEGAVLVGLLRGRFRVILGGH